MDEFLGTFINWVYDIVDVLRIPSFNIGGVYGVTFFDLIVACIIISIVVGVVWKGARG